MQGGIKMAEIVHQALFGNQFRVCPECGYQDGFHTMLKKEGEKIKWLFICPSCHRIFDIGYRIPAESIEH